MGLRTKDDSDQMQSWEYATMSIYGKPLDYDPLQIPQHILSEV
jgi:hypothetical protein